MAARTVALVADGIDGYHRNVGTCRGCGQKILWCLTAKNRKPIPFDDLELSGILSDDGEIEVVETDGLHWATCPNAKDFRR